MPSRALALPSAAALLATIKTTAASVTPRLYAAVGAAMAFLLGLRLVFGTLASCLPFGCKVRTARRERTRERKKERKRRRWHGCFDQRQAMAVGERKKMASPLFRAQKGLSFVDVSNSSFLFCPRARKNRKSCSLSGRKEAHLNGRESSRCFWRVFAFPFFFSVDGAHGFFEGKSSRKKTKPSPLTCSLLSSFFLSFFLSFFFTPGPCPTLFLNRSQPYKKQ